MLFRLDADGSNYEVLHEFGATAANTDGIRPTSLAVGADGHIYGTTLIGGVNSNGVIFRWNTTGSTYEALYAFNALTAHTALGSNTRPCSSGRHSATPWRTAATSEWVVPRSMPTATRRWCGSGDWPGSEICSNAM